LQRAFKEIIEEVIARMTTATVRHRRRVLRVTGKKENNFEHFK
jgi:hypothetical protein